MRLLAVVASLVLTTLSLPGCMDLFGSGDDEAVGQVREFTLVVPAQSSDTVELYELNNGNKMKVVSIGFEAVDQETRMVPNPEIRVKEGDTVVIRLINQNPLAHTLHVHGNLDDWEDDGVDYLTQFPVRAGEEYVYTFENVKAGTYWYHCHVDGAHHIDLGMYGAFIVEERDPPQEYDRDFVVMLDEWDNCHVHGNTDPVNPSSTEQNGEYAERAGCLQRFLNDYLYQNRIATTVGSSVPQPVKDAMCPAIDMLPEDTPEQKTAKAQLQTLYGCAGAHEHGTPPVQQTPKQWWPETPPVYNPTYNTYLINGKAFPDNAPFPVREGETVRFRLINVGNQMHSFHLHGHTMLVTHRDGYELDSPYKLDTLSIGPGERYDFIVEANNPGIWMIHDQNGIAMTNDDQHPGGMMGCMAYQGFGGIDAFAMTRSLDCHTEAMRILEERGGHGEHGGNADANGEVHSMFQGAGSSPMEGMGH